MKKKNQNVPVGVIERLPAYLNSLLQLKKQSVNTVSSKKLGAMTGVNPAQIRRDLIQFGQFGIHGVGYEVRQLTDKLQNILGADVLHNIAVIGAGKLGLAIANHDGLKKHGFIVTAVFDNDPSKIGKVMSGVKISDLGELKEIMAEEDINVGIIATPPAVAQKSADKLIEAGASVILNYTSVMIEAPESVKVHNSDPVNELLYTLYYFTNKRD